MTQRIVILGGHGKVARLLAPKLKTAGFAVDAVIRKPEQEDDIQAAGASPVVLNMETASIDDFAQLFAGAAAIVFSAGAGGDSAERTRAVDFEAATRTMEAAEKVGVKRYIMVSYARAADHYRELGPDHDFYPYAKAKHDADAYLRESRLDYTILGPGLLTLEPATRKLQVADAHGVVEGDWPDEKNVTSRENVAEVITHVIKHDAAVGQTVNFYDGDTPLVQALEQAGDKSPSTPGEVVVRGNADGFAQHVSAGGHKLLADEPESAGGTGTGPGPYDFLLTALGACTSMTLSLYARRKKWPLDDVTVTLRHAKIHAKDCESCETKEGKLDRIERDIELHGALSDEQRAKLLEIADKCPVHRTLTSEIDIQTRSV